MVIDMAATEIQRVLLARAAKLSKRTVEKVSGEKKSPISVIEIGTESFGIPTRHLSCIIKSPPIALIPNLPSWFRGLAQIRGELVGVLDVAIWFGLPESSGGTFLAVVEEKGLRLGLLLDKVAGFREVGQNDIAETFSGVSIGGHPIQATTKDVTTILDIPKLFENADMVVEPVGAMRASLIDSPKRSNGSNSSGVSL